MENRARSCPPIINNYHVFHARTAYEDDREAGLVRHLKRLWLVTDVLGDRPPYFERNLSSDWDKASSVSRIEIDGAASRSPTVNVST